MLENSKAWTAEYDKQMDLWLEAYLTWLTQSPLGIEGSKQVNNHGSWYHFQVSALAYYLGKKDIASQAIDGAKNTMKVQFAPDGSQPEELARTRSFFYSCFNLDALSRVAIVADKLGSPLWQTQVEQGKSIHAGVEYLLPIVNGEKWTYPTPGVKLDYLVPVLVKYNQYNETPNYVKELQSITHFKGDDVQKVYNQLSILESEEM